MRLLKKLLPLFPRSVHTSLAAREKPCEAAGSLKHVCYICLCVYTYVCREAYVESPREARRGAQRGQERPREARNQLTGAIQGLVFAWLLTESMMMI